MHHMSWDGPIPIPKPEPDVTGGAACSDTSRDHGTAFLVWDKEMGSDPTRRLLGDGQASMA